MKRGFIVLELMFVVLFGTVVGYAINRGIVAIEYAPPCEQSVEHDRFPVDNLPGMGK